MTRKRILLLAALGLGGVAGIGFLGWQRIMGAPVQINRVERREVVQTVVATGRVETPSRVEIGTQIAGAVTDVLVNEGQAIKARDILIQLDQSEGLANVELARAGLAQAQGKLTQLSDFSLPSALEAFELAKANEINARNQFERISQLTARGIATPVQLDEVRRAYDVAVSQMRSAQLQIATVSTGGSDVLLARAALQQAQATLSMAEAKLGYLTIRAPADGVVITRSLEPGSVAQPGKALLVISPTRETRLVIQIDERNLALVAIGQGALASADAYPGQRFKAQLAFINPAVDPARGSVEVKLSVPQPPGYLREDMTVSVDIEVARHADVLVLPTGAVRDSFSTEPWVLAVVDGRAVRRPVRLGARGAAIIEIVNGLAQGDVVVPSADIATTEGRRVRVSAP